MFDEFKEIIQSWLNWFRRLPVLVKAFFWLVVMVSLCSYCCDVTALMYGEAWLDTELPAEAKGTRGMYWWGMQGTDRVQISFRITPKQLEKFIENSCIEPLQDSFNPLDRNPPLNDDFIASISLDNMDYQRKNLAALVFGKWQRTGFRQYAGSTGTCLEGGGYEHGYDLVVDQTNPELYTVYIQIWGRSKP